MNEDVLQFRTHDLALASALVSCGFSLDNIERKSHGGKASFIFVHAENLEDIIQAYWADKLTVNPKAYFDVIKHIKTRLYQS